MEDDGVFRTAGDTILGADNKAAVTVVMELGARLAAEPAPVGLEMVFTVAEEQGLRGASALDVEALRSKLGYVLDHATPIGEIDHRGPDLQEGDRRVHGASSRTPASGRRTAAARSRPQPPPSRPWTWAGSTTRRPPTSA